MAYWNKHKLAEPPVDDLTLDVYDKVRAVTDLPGVPAGTRGKVALVNGFEWRRYHVLFENGESLANLDSRSVAKA